MSTEGIALFMLPEDNLPESSSPTEPMGEVPPVNQSVTPAPAPPRNTNGIITAVIVIAVVLVLIGGGIYLSNRPGGLIAQASPTATPRPTATAVPTATLIPTVVVGTLPSPAAGFKQYMSNSGTWGVNYPQTATATAGLTPLQGFAIPSTTFAISPTTSYVVLDVPLVIPDTQVATIFNQIVQGAGATNVVVVNPLAPVTIGSTTWQQTTVTATVNGVTTTNTALYTAHGTGSIGILYTAPSDTFAATNAQSFTPMMQSFTFLK